MSLYITSLKAFGDFVVAHQTLRHIASTAGGPRPTIVAGRHLSALADALGVHECLHLIGDKTWTDVPAAFDMRRCGTLAGLRSVLDLRRRLASLARDTRLVFDRVGWRERFISGRATPVALPTGADNIYLAYEDLLQSEGFTLTRPAQSRDSAAQSAVIVPGSRIARKALPPQVIASVHSRLAQRGVAATVLMLEGETVVVPDGVPSCVVPKSFPSLIAALKAVDMVVSADSLPAHLGEYYGLPTFVIAPTPNRFWLPQAAFLLNFWGTFDNLGRVSAWLDRYA